MDAPADHQALLASLVTERDALLALLPRFDDQRYREPLRADGWSPHDIACHVADATYGLALMALGEVPTPGPLDANGQLPVAELNEQRRQRNAALPREKVLSRTASAFDHARRAVEASSDLAAPGPYGPAVPLAAWFDRLIQHARDHRAELEGLL